MTRRTTARLAGFMFLAYIAIGITGLILFKRATGGAEGAVATLASMAQHAPLVRATVVITLLTFFVATSRWLGARLASAVRAQVAVSLTNGPLSTAEPAASLYNCEWGSHRVLMADRAAVPTSNVSLKDALARLPGPASERSVLLFEHGTLQVKLYAPRGHDPQTPHARDEIYVVAAGRGFFFDGQERRLFEPGTFLFAAAGRPHRFEDFTDDFAVWVFFYGPDGGEA